MTFDLEGQVQGQIVIEMEKFAFFVKFALLLASKIITQAHLIGGTQYFTQR